MGYTTWTVFLVDLSTAYIHSGPDAASLVEVVCGHVKIYRLSLSKHVDTAFSGEGSRRVGGRWTPPGYPAVYTASSRALAVLETVVHTGQTVFPSHHVIEVEVPDDLDIETVDIHYLSKEWQSNPAPLELQSIGQEWLASGSTVLLRVPSAIVPQESNYVINPVHPDFVRLQLSEPIPFKIDGRLALVE